MSGRFNNKALWLVFIILAIVFVVTRFTGIRQGNTTLMTDVVSIDTGKVSSVTLIPLAEAGRQLEFRRSENGWQVTREGITAPAAPRAVGNLLAEIGSLRAEQLVSRDPERWADFSVTDSLGSRIVIHEDNREILDLVVGRFQYQPPPRDNMNMYGQNRVTGKTYIRLNGKEEVYSVDGFFALSVNRPFGQWRDNTVSRVNRAMLSRLLLEYPADSGFVATRSDERWQVAGLSADSASMEQYLNQLRYTTHSEFEDAARPEGEPEFSLTMEGDNMSPVMIRAYAAGDGSYLINSSINPSTWFRTAADGLFRDLFPGAPVLLKSGS